MNSYKRSDIDWRTPKGRASSNYSISNLESPIKVHAAAAVPLIGISSSLAIELSESQVVFGSSVAFEVKYTKVTFVVAWSRNKSSTRTSSNQSLNERR